MFNLSLQTAQTPEDWRRGIVTPTVTRWLDEGDTVDIVYLDFAKAFDSLNYRLPVTELKFYGIASSFINWIESYL